MITEWELECALCSRFALLLPDLYAQGFQIERQVLLSGLSRRMDIVLRKPNQTWIIELKRGSPDVAHTSDQILDYRSCWRASYPNDFVNLMVVSTRASEAKIKAFSELGISYRAVSESRILEVLSEGISTELLGRCNRLRTGDEERIRFLLSNFAATTVPEGMQFGPPWTHESVFYALIRDGREHKKPWLKNIYVRLFDQKPNCAVLYHPEANIKDGAPLHINTRARSWPLDGWVLSTLVENQAIEYVATDRKGSGKQYVNFDHYKVIDWDKLAAVLQLGTN